MKNMIRTSKQNTAESRKKLKKNRIQNRKKQISRLKEKSKAEEIEKNINGKRRGEQKEGI